MHPRYGLKRVFLEKKRQRGLICRPRAAGMHWRAMLVKMNSCGSVIVGWRVHDQQFGTERLSPDA